MVRFFKKVLVKVFLPFLLFFGLASVRYSVFPYLFSPSRAPRLLLVSLFILLFFERSSLFLASAQTLSCSYCLYVFSRRSFWTIFFPLLLASLLVKGIVNFLKGESFFLFLVLLTVFLALREGLLFPLLFFSGEKAGPPFLPLRFLFDLVFGSLFYLLGYVFFLRKRV